MPADQTYPLRALEIRDDVGWTTFAFTLLSDNMHRLPANKARQRRGAGFIRPQLRKMWRLLSLPVPVEFEVTMRAKIGSRVSVETEEIVGICGFHSLQSQAELYHNRAVFELRTIRENRTLVGLPMPHTLADPTFVTQQVAMCS